MKTKHKNLKNNKTKKNMTKLISDDVNRENHLACYLSSNTNVKEFTFDIFYFVINYWKKHYPTKWKTIIGEELLEKINENVIQKIGFTINERNNIYKISKKNDFIKYLDDKFFKVTSVLNNLSKPDFAFYHVDINTKLQNKFISNLSKLFLINDFKWNDFSKIYNSVPKEYRKSYNFFIFNIIIYGSNDDSNMSLYKKNLVYFDFIKKNLPDKDKNKEEYLNKITNCNKSIVSGDKYDDYSIYDARNFYLIDDKMPYAQIMKLNDEQYLAGPSGSTSILYINLFDFYGLKKTKKNKIMILCLIIADYIPLWHTLPEILLSANIELKPYNTPNYHLEKDPVDYVVKLIKPYI